MPRIEAHSLAGVAAGAVAVPLVGRMLVSELSPGEKAGVMGATLLGSCLPDLLEPAFSPSHRGLFHSVLAGIGLVAGLAQITTLNSDERATTRTSHGGETVGWYCRQPEPEAYPWLKPISALLIALIIGYLLHLVMDSTTPKGLPLLGN